MSKGGDLVARRLEAPDHSRADETSRAGHENAHVPSSVSGRQEFIPVLPRVLDQPRMPLVPAALWPATGGPPHGATVCQPTLLCLTHATAGALARPR